MDKRDAYKLASLRNKATGHSVTVLHIDDESAQVDNWDTGETTTQPLEAFLNDHEPLVRPNGLPRYTVAVLEACPGFAKSVRVSVAELDEAFVDECEPLELHAKTEGLAALNSYLEALAKAEAWLSRESRGTQGMSTQPLAGHPGWTVELCGATSNKRYPNAWFELLIAPEQSDIADISNFLELSFRDEELAQPLAAAVASGTIYLQRAN